MTDTEQEGPSTASPTLLTFLIADVRGYTRFTVEHGDEAAARLADRFAAICEEIVGSHGGQVIELRGDEALAVFPSARNALRGAVALQEAFRHAAAGDPSLPLSVGMGLDAGESIPVRGGYRGGALNLAARLCSIAAAGEVLASEGVVYLARKTEGLAFVDRGEVRLKGLAAPVRVLQIAPEGEIPSELPALQPILVTYPTNLPDEPTPFIGREKDVRAVTDLMRRPAVRLVTLTGPGGTGKTRLALQAGTALLYDFPQGVFFVSLGPLTASDLVPSAIAETLDIQEEPGRPLIETLSAELGDRRLLLVLDNFEHLMEAASAVAHLLDACQHLSVLVTSRAVLRLSREQEYPVSPLSLPDPGRLPDVESLSQYDAVRLFIERVRAVKPDFEVTNENAPAVAEVCVRLDGLPLALELTAARVRLFPPQALLGRLQSRLTLLTGGARDRPTRQQTLRGAIEWSHSLLTAEEQCLFARLAVFAGGCTFDAAEAVCNRAGDLDILEGVTSLVEKSLLRQEGEEEPRFRMLETIREFALERLVASGSEHEIRDAHAAYYLALTEEGKAAMRTAEQGRWMAILSREYENTRQAFDHMLVSGDDEAACRLAVAMARWWVSGARKTEGTRIFDQLLPRAGSLPPELRAELYMSASLFHFDRSTQEQRRLVSRAIDLYREVGNRRAAAEALLLFAGYSTEAGDFEGAEQYAEEGLALAREVGDQEMIVRGRRFAGSRAFYRNDLATARTHLEEAHELALRLGNPYLLSESWYWIAWLSLVAGEFDRAEHAVNEADRLYVELGLEAPRQFLHWARALIVILQARPAEARQHLDIASRLDLERGAPIMYRFLEAYACAAASEGRAVRAVRLWGAAEAQRERLGTPIDPITRERLWPLVDAARNTLDEATWDAAWAEGAAMDTSALNTYAIENRD